MSSIPENLAYTQEHEWVDLTDGVATVGVTAYAAEQLGDVVYVQLPEVGATATEGESFGEIESTKSVSELFAPVAGEVVEVNEAVVDAPEHVNNDPYGDGWLVRIRLAGDAPELLSATDYTKLTTEGDA
ncbi:glycine cleavage system protein GcvH [Actinokineospora pegani]|uniref:glycine cleavage system protein GcvH n=1 Tax=Actinokineospora pegani TaxID=2654637 RepID=UPI0012EA5ACF|nr:glycine cleavage system protein GcvH [Actinokineospora pegani]